VRERGAHPAFGDNALVYPVLRGPEPLALKISIDREEVVSEVRLLRLWDGHGMVRLIEADPACGILLLERLGTGRTLRDVPLPDALPIAGQLMRRLVIPAPDGVGLIRTGRIARDVLYTLSENNRAAGEPLPGPLINEIEAIAAPLAQPVQMVITHADLHYDNILPGDREPWLAIDPRARLGDPEISVAELLWTRVDEVGDADGIRQMLDVLVSSAGLDPDRARRWAVLRSADYLLWGLGHELTIDPPRCRRVIDALIS
jgi:streptomycin 6-kinase